MNRKRFIASKEAYQEDAPQKAFPEHKRGMSRHGSKRWRNRKHRIEEKCTRTQMKRALELAPCSPLNASSEKSNHADAENWVIFKEKKGTLLMT